MIFIDVMDWYLEWNYIEFLAEGMWDPLMSGGR